MKFSLKRPGYLLLIIVLIAAILRLYRLGTLPTGFIPEEVSTGWNAYSILKTGRDEWNKRFPLVFQESGGNKLPLSSYLTVPSVALFGLNEFAVRLPTAAAGIFAIFLTFIASKEFFKSTKISLLSSLFLAINPWHIAMSRYAVETNLGIPLFLLGLILFLKSLKKPIYLIPSVVVFSLTFMTYYNYVVFTSLFLCSTIFIYRKWLHSLPVRKYSVLSLSLFLIIIFPSVVVPSLVTRYNQVTSIESIAQSNRINVQRGACQSVYPSVLCRIVYNKISDKIVSLSKNIINHYSTTIHYVDGSSLGLSGMPKEWGFFHIHEFVLIILGAVFLISTRRLHPLMIVWLTIFAVPSALASPAHIWRMMTLLPLPQLFVAAGFYHGLLKRYRLIVVVVGLVIGFSVARFWADYTGVFPYTQSANSYYGFREMYAYLDTIDEEYSYVGIVPSGLGFRQLYIYYLFYAKYDPRLYQNEVEVERIKQKDEWIDVKRIGKYHFASDLSAVEQELSSKPILVAEGNFSLDREHRIDVDTILKFTLLRTIYYPNNDPAFKIMEIHKTASPSANTLM